MDNLCLKKLLVILVLLACVAVVVAQVCTRAIPITRTDLPFTVTDDFWNQNMVDVIGYKILRANGHYIYKPVGCSLDGLPVLVSLLQSPTTMTLDPTTDQIEWYPKIEDVGYHWLVISVTSEPPIGYKAESDVVAFILEVRRYRQPWFQSLDTILEEG